MPGDPISKVTWQRLRTYSGLAGFIFAGAGTIACGFCAFGGEFPLTEMMWGTIFWSLSAVSGIVWLVALRCSRRPPSAPLGPRGFDVVMPEAPAMLECPMCGTNLGTPASPASGALHVPDVGWFCSRACADAHAALY